MKWIGLGNGSNNLAQRSTSNRHSLPSTQTREPAAVVERNPDEDKLWSEPLLQFNPAIGIQNDQVLFGDRDHRELGYAANRAAAAERRSGIGRVANRLLDGAFRPHNAAHNFFARSRHFGGNLPSATELASAIDAGIDLDGGAYALMVHPVGAWLETAIAFDVCEDHFVLAGPRCISALGELLATAADKDTEQCTQFLQEFLRWISAVKQQMNGGGMPHALPRFQLHHFISISGTVFSTLDQVGSPPGLRRAPFQQSGDKTEKPIYRNVFSRASGDTLVCVSKIGHRLMPRDFWERSDDKAGATDGYLIVDDELWHPADDYDLLPEAWMRQTKHGPAPKAKYQPYFPTEIYFDEFGNCADLASLRFTGWFVKAPLLFDPTGLPL